MKKYIILIISNIFFLSVSAQETGEDVPSVGTTDPIVVPNAEAPAGTRIEFTYDATGNRRTKRYIIETLKSAKTNSTIKEKQNEIVECIKLYPNPTHGYVYIEIQGYDSEMRSKLILLNTSGITLFQTANIKPAFNLNLSSYPDGIYLLRMFIGESVWEWKIIKE